MKPESTDLSRRNFLSKGAAVAATASIISIPAVASPAPGQSRRAAANSVMSGDPVTTTEIQTLTNKTIPSSDNTIGTDYVNIKEYGIDGTDITDALEDAIGALSATGGQILIPRGMWTSRGGHDLQSSISIEGAVSYPNPDVAGTQITLSGKETSDFMFRIQANRQKCSLKNLLINMTIDSGETGLLLTNTVDTDGTWIYNTYLENVGFYGGAFGVKVDSLQTGSTNNFETTLARFERVSFIACNTGFFCNSVNGGYAFDTCYFSLLENGTALECYTMGNIAIEHCIFVGNSNVEPGEFPTDGTTILKTTGAFNNISFYNCQDEKIQYAYQNDHNHYDYVSLVYRSCLIQSKLKYTANGSVIFDSCRLKVDSATGAVLDKAPGPNPVTHPGAYVLVYLRGTNSIATGSVDNGGPVGTFLHPNSHVYQEARDVGSAVIMSAPPVSPATTYTINTTRGAVIIDSGAISIQVYNSLVTPDSLVFTTQRTDDPGGARVRVVACGAGYFVIYLSQNAAAALSIGFRVEI